MAPLTTGRGTSERGAGAGRGCPLKVVYVSTLTSGGPVSHLLDLAPAVADAGGDVSVIAGSDAVAAQFRERGIPATGVTVRSKWDVVGAARLLPVGLGRGDIVHSQDRRAGLFARPIARARGAAVFHTYHGLPEDIAVRVGRSDPPAGPPPSMTRRLWLFQGYLRIEAALARLGHVVVPSQAMASFLVAAGLPEARVHVQPSGIDVRRTDPGPRHEPFAVATAANLEHWKGIDVLLHSLREVSQPVHLDIYGDGADEASLRTLARSLDAPATFHGRVPDVRARLLEADLFVLPSRAENLPIAILEAMAAALPVVATRVGGVPELVEDGVTGRVVPPDDPAALGAAIESIAADEDARRQMGRSGAVRAAERFDVGDVGRRTLLLYEAMCASSR